MDRDGIYKNEQFKWKENQNGLSRREELETTEEFLGKAYERRLQNWTQSPSPFPGTANFIFQDILE